MRVIMATVSEAYEAHTKKIDASGNLISAQIIYVVVAAQNEDEALQQVLETAEKKINNIPLQSIEIDRKDNENTFHVSANYEMSSSGGSGDRNNGYTEEDDQTVSFDCSGGTKHVTRAYQQKRVYGGNFDDANCGIGWNGKTGSDSNFAGVDIPTADMRLTYTKVLSRSKAFSTDYQRNVASVVGNINNAPFKGWQTGEVMFLGCSYSTPEKSRDKITVTFNFRIQQNEKNASISGIPIGKKYGFDYIWVRSGTVVNSSSLPENKIESIYLSRVCEFADFRKLGL